VSEDFHSDLSGLTMAESESFRLVGVADIFVDFVLIHSFGMIWGEW